MPLIGFLNPNAPEAIEKVMAGFRGGLSETGYVEGRDARCTDRGQPDWDQKAIRYNQTRSGCN
jgi:hypothetical protein